MLNRIGSKIKHLRIKGGLSQQELCSDLLNRSILSHIENNKMLPSLEQLNYLSKMLKVDICYFFKDDTNISYDCAEEPSIYEELYIKNKYDKIINMFKESDGATFKEDNSILYYVGMAFFNLNIKGDALKLLRRFIFRYTRLAYEDQKKLSFNAIICLNTLFKLMLNNKNYDKGIHYLTLAKKYIYLFDIIDSEQSYIIHSNLAYAYFLKAKYSSMINLLETFISYNKKLIYSQIIPDIHLNLSLAYYNTDQYSLALDHINKSSFFYNYIGKTNLAKLNNLNIINIYKFTNQFDKAFLLLRDCISECIESPDIYSRFQTQEAILYFNLGDYVKTLEVLNLISYKNLSILNKKGYMLMKAHIALINKDYKTAENYFKKCKNYYVSNNYNQDLSLIYTDMFYITKDNVYLELLKKVRLEPVRKNIVIKWHNP